MKTLLAISSRTGTVKQGDLVTFKVDSLTDDLNNPAKSTSTTIKVQTRDELVLVFCFGGGITNLTNKSELIGRL